MTTHLTPSIVAVRLVTVKTSIAGSSSLVPRYRIVVPGLNGSHALSMAATKLTWSIGSEPGLAKGEGEGDDSGDVAEATGDGEAATPDGGGLAGVAVAQAAHRLSAAKTAARPAEPLVASARLGTRAASARAAGVGTPIVPRRFGGFGAIGFMWLLRTGGRRRGPWRPIGLRRGS